MPRFLILPPKLSEVTHQFRREMAALLEPALNLHISDPTRFDASDLEGKKKVSDFVNSELEALGLAAQCPNTGLPAKLKATSGSLIGVGRFYFEIYVDGKQKKSAYSDTLPNLKLMDALPRQSSRKLLGRITLAQRRGDSAANFPDFLRRIFPHPIAFVNAVD